MNKWGCRNRQEIFLVATQALQRARTKTYHLWYDSRSSALVILPPPATPKRVFFWWLVTLFLWLWRVEVSWWTSHFVCCLPPERFAVRTFSGQTMAACAHLQLVSIPLSCLCLTLYSTSSVHSTNICEVSFCSRQCASLFYPLIRILNDLRWKL